MDKTQKTLSSAMLFVCMRAILQIKDRQYTSVRIGVWFISGLLLFCDVAESHAQDLSVESLRGAYDSVLRQLDNVQVSYHQTISGAGYNSDLDFNVVLTENEGQAIFRDRKLVIDSAKLPNIPATAENLSGFLSTGYSVDLYDLSSQAPRRGRYVSAKGTAASSKTDTAFLVSADPQADLPIYFPLVMNNREMPFTGYLYKPFSDRALSLPIEKWEIGGREIFQGRECLVVKISQPDKPTNSKERINRPYFRIGFDPAENYFPVYFEECLDIVLNDIVITKSPAIYRKSVFEDFREFAGGMRFPSLMTETENSYDGGVGIAERLAKLKPGGKFEDFEPSDVKLTRWEIFSIQHLISKPELWIEIPDNCLVSDAGLNEQYITGMDREASDKLLGVGIYRNAELSKPADSWISRPIIIVINIIVICLILALCIRKQKK